MDSALQKHLKIPQGVIFIFNDRAQKNPEFKANNHKKLPKRGGKGSSSCKIPNSRLWGISNGSGVALLEFLLCTFPKKKKKGEGAEMGSFGAEGFKPGVVSPTRALGGIRLGSRHQKGFNSSQKSPALPWKYK